MIAVGMGWCLGSKVSLHGIGIGIGIENRCESEDVSMGTAQIRARGWLLWHFIITSKGG